MKSSIYPEDTKTWSALSEVVDGLKAAWKRLIESGKELSADLPDDSVLEAFAAGALQASLRTEELRAVRCRLLLLSRTAAQGLPEYHGIDCIPFLEPRPYTAHELTKLAPAAPVSEVMVGVELANGRLEIWGLVHTGKTWHEFAHYLSDSAIGPPDALAVETTGPASVRFSRGPHTLLVVNGGLVSASAPPLDRIPHIWAVFASAEAKLAEEGAKKVRGPNSTVSKETLRYRSGPPYRNSRHTLGNSSTARLCSLYRTDSERRTSDCLTAW